MKSILILIGVTTVTLLLGQVVSSAQDKVTRAQANEAAILKTFRQEFILVQPGKGKFPQELRTTNPGTKKEIIIKFSQELEVSKYEVTQNLWQLIMGSNPSRWKGDRNSVEMMTFAQSVEFCEKLTKELRKRKLISAEQLVRLPTELEWEYCCAAGTTTRYSFGDDPAKLGQHAWYTENAAGNDPPVGAKKPNPWGLYDVHGYLWEFTIDSWADDKPLVELPNSQWPLAKASVVLKSGSWKDPAKSLETIFRVRADKKLKDDAVGLRVLITKKRATN